MTNINESKVLLDVTIKSKEKVLFDGASHSVTSKNERGIFDVLPFHTNFITLIVDYVILDKGLSTEQKFNMEKGVFYVLANKVDVYVGI